MIPTTKPFTQNHLSCSTNALKLTYNKVALQKYSSGCTPGPPCRAASNAAREGASIRGRRGASYFKLLRASLLANLALNYGALRQ